MLLAAPYQDTHRVCPVPGNANLDLFVKVAPCRFLYQVTIFFFKVTSNWWNSLRPRSILALFRLPPARFSIHGGCPDQLLLR